MKRYGHTLDGNVLIECTNDEYSAMTMLAEIVAGGSPMNGRKSQFDINRVDLKATFEAIMIWMLVKGYANSLRKMADDMDKSLKVEDNASSNASDPTPQAAPVSA